MASKNNPKSSAQLIREHSKARVITASNKSFLVPSDFGIRTSRQMRDHDVVESMVRKYK